MTYPVPPRLEPVRAEVNRRKVITMLALISCILFVLAAFGVSFDEVNIVALGLAFLAAHFIVPLALPGRR